MPCICWPPQHKNALGMHRYTLVVMCWPAGQPQDGDDHSMQLPQTLLHRVQALAATAPDSEERFRARRQLPGMAKRLREVRPDCVTGHTCARGCWPHVLRS